MKNIFTSIIALSFFCELCYSQNTWIQKTNFGGIARSWSVGFSIGNKGYIGTGADASITGLSDIWEYDTTSNSWTQKVSFLAGIRWEVTAFSIGAKGYLGTGDNSNDQNDWWEYDPAGNTWTQKANFGGVARADAVGFTIGNKGYVSTGFSGNGPYTFYNDFWEYDPVTNTWAQKANFPGSNRYRASGFSTTCRGYIGSGWNGSNYFNDWWEYNPGNNSWIQIANFGGGNRNNAASFAIGKNGYVGTGDNGSYKNDLWKYTPNNVSANVSSNITITQGNSATLTASGGGTYSWSSGASTSFIVVNPNTTTVYTVIVTDSNGCTDAASVVVYVIEPDCGNPDTDLFIPNVFSPNNDGENDVLNLFTKKGLPA